MTTSPTPAEASSTSAGPASIHERLRALADEWNALAAEAQAAYQVWGAEGRHDVAWIAEGRARQLNACANDLRALLEES